MSQSLAVLPNIESYVWSFPGSPVRIHLHLEAAERLLATIPTVGDEAPLREVGGVLLGRAESPLRIEITDFQPIFTNATADGKYTLGPELEQARRTAESRSDGVTVIGFYRSHLREDLRLDEADLAAFQVEFPSSTDVCLLIKPLSDGSMTAGFFFWDNGTIESGFSFNEFPFDVQRLRLDAIEQNWIRERATKAEFQGWEPRTLKRGDIRLTTPWLAFIGVLVLALGVGAMVLGIGAGNGGWNRKSEAHTQIKANEAVDQRSTLGLRVDSLNQDLRVTWNYLAPIVRDRTARGVLTIVDGDLPERKIQLSTEELQMPGSITYAPVNRSVRFRLEVKGADQHASEFVLSIKAAPKPQRQRERG
jgi:hypothetical protein